MKSRFDPIQLVLIAAATVFGAVLRIYQVTNQILTGDEWHAIITAINWDAAEILTDFGSGGHSIPVALYYEFLISTIGLSELTLYLPFLFSGIILIFAIPMAVKGMTDSSVSVTIVAWLLAISPVLIFYSRFARPYGIVVLLGFCAVTFFYKWWQCKKTVYAAGYAFTGWLAIYFHIIAIPFILGPFAYFFICSLFSNHRWMVIKQLFKVGMGTALLLCLTLALPIANSLDSLTVKTGYSEIELATVLKAFRLLICGTDNIFVSIVVLIFLSIGVYHLFTRSANGPFFGYLSFLSMLQVLFVVISKPLAVNGPHIFARYIIIILPLLLLVLATGIDAVCSCFKKNRIHQAIVMIAVFAMLFFKGPIPSSIFGYSNMANNLILAQMILGETYKDHVFSKLIKKVPGFYRKIAANPPGSLRIVEVPYHYNGYHFYFYQLIHRQRVTMGFINGLCAQRRQGEIPLSIKNARLDGFTYLNDPDALKKKEIDYVVFHKHMKNEINYKAEYKDVNLDGCISKFRSWFGEPSYEDNNLIVFSILK